MDKAGAPRLLRRSNCPAPAANDASFSPNGIAGFLVLGLDPEGELTVRTN